MHLKKPLFIAFEGIDGSGKSTQSRILANRLREEGFSVHQTFEPTDSPIGKMIRAVFSGKMKADHKTIAGLFVADRLNHILNQEDGMLKKLEEGYIVISDRYYFSSYAYHSVHMNMDWVIQANAMSATLLRPDLNIFIDVAPETSMKRIQHGREEIELYETLENLTKVREQYQIAFDRLREEEKIIRFAGEQNEESLAEQIYQSVAQLMD